MRARLLVIAAATVLAACSYEGPEIPVFPAGSAGVKTFRASTDDGTRASLSMSPAGASVLWDSGDLITVCADSAGKKSFVRNFSTAIGGSSHAEFSCDDWNLPFDAATALIAFYPAETFRKVSLGSDGRYRVAIAIPPVQTAVKGGIDRGLGISIACAPADAEVLHFKNALALVRFRLAGENASRISRVVFQAGETIAGDGAWICSAEGGETTMGTRFNPVIYGSLSSVELTGSFEDGGDYYIATAPVTSGGFSFSFYDSSNNVICRSSSTTVSLARSRINDFGTINIDDGFESLPAGVERYLTQTKGANPLVLAVTGDGFTAGEQALFSRLAREAIDFLFNAEPFKTYREWFSVYLMQAVSNESGGSVTDGKGNVTEEHDTFFKTRWGTENYTDMGCDRNKVKSFVSEHCPEILDGTLTIDDVPVLVLINDKRYGGICLNWKEGGCIAMVPYVNSGSGTILWSFPDQIACDDADPLGGVRDITDDELAAMGGFYNATHMRYFTSKGNWRNIALHEFGGHGFGRLGDEYWDEPLSASDATNAKLDAYNSWAVPFGLNTTGNYDDAPWKADLLDNFDVLSRLDPRYCARIGRFQGADNYALNRWRSELISCMIDNRTYFSTWQRILIVRRIMEKAGEPFSLDDFFARDNPADRLRDPAAQTGSRRGEGAVPQEESFGPYMFCGPLPPPVMLDD